MKMESITFITGNEAKAKQLGYHLDYPVEHVKLDLPEMQSLDLREIIEHKAKAAYAEVQKTVLVEDTSLIFNALGRLPGPLIKWFLEELKLEGLCKILDGYGDRSARAEVLFGLYDGKDFEVFAGEMKGTIAHRPKGEEGFGWDPIFIPEGHEKTWGEMNAEEQSQTSMRRIALKKLEAFLKK
jgi:non-canonical purine NTP pyrophosphatase (RdgB/HAM1 family)